MAVDIEALIAPLSDDEGERAGPDLSYSNERATIEAPFLLDANGEEVDQNAWRDCVRAIRQQVEQTRDVWLAVYLARGGAKLGDLQTVADGTALLAGLFEGMWDDVHPTLDEADFIGRKSPCDSLTKIREFLGPLKRATVFEHRMGKVTGEDLQRFASEGAGAEGYAQFRAAVETTDPDRAAEITAAFEEAVAKLDAIRDSITRADQVLVANAGSETGTNFQTTYDTLAALRRAAMPYAGMTAETDASADSAEAGGGAGPASVSGAHGPALSGTVNSRDDVVRAIDAVIEYYRTREPGSPVPVLMKRARHWVSMDFLELLDDLVPDSMDGARKVLVSKLDAPPDADDSDY
jgi:type VI secretion system protein ImpA